MEPFTKAVIRVPAVVSSLRVVAGLQRLLSFPANSELVYLQLLDHFCQAYFHVHKFLVIQQNRH